MQIKTQTQTPKQEEIEQKIVEKLKERGGKDSFNGLIDLLPGENEDEVGACIIYLEKIGVVQFGGYVQKGLCLTIEVILCEQKQ